MDLPELIDIFFAILGRGGKVGLYLPYPCPGVQQLSPRLARMAFWFGYGACPSIQLELNV
jgi:hypothetical protein